MTVLYIFYFVEGASEISTWSNCNNCLFCLYWIFGAKLVYHYVTNLTASNLL